MEKETYVKKRQVAQENPELYMSLIIDGMSQDHCILPYFGNKKGRRNVEAENHWSKAAWIR